MDIKPSTMTITQLLSSRCQFSIPRFQREYSWEKRNYQEFFDDMLGCLKIDGNDKLSERIFQYIMTEDDNGDLVRILQSKTHYPFFSYYIQDIKKR